MKIAIFAIYAVFIKGKFPFSSFPYTYRKKANAKKAEYEKYNTVLLCRYSVLKDSCLVGKKAHF